MLKGNIELNGMELMTWTAERAYRDADGRMVYNVTVDSLRTTGYPEHGEWEMTARQGGARYIAAQIMTECTPHMNIVHIKE